LLGALFARVHPPQGKPIGIGNGGLCAYAAVGSTSGGITPVAMSAPTSKVNLPNWGARVCILSIFCLFFFIVYLSVNFHVGLHGET
jgi:hypothetical protein